jgi:hypothetical protein
MSADGADGIFGSPISKGIWPASIPVSIGFFANGRTIGADGALCVPVSICVAIVSTPASINAPTDGIFRLI